MVDLGAVLTQAKTITNLPAASPDHVSGINRSIS